jgi:hypothetical protein
MMPNFGYNKPIVMYIIFYTNLTKYPLLSLLVFNDWMNGILSFGYLPIK